ncbi:MAG: hypothetical protein A3J24_10215 [Deltaproteobacteria bacterium RIFCSPLOWO2_02_FULL_53_8]|nr:MAG: hypothetical protein A3J24_10215 [Deltaproteobacteria bacterium RIFCSPLOWO2_02_FULL_53_8]
MLELKKWEPLKELSTIQRDMDEFVRRFFSTMTPAGLFRKELVSEWYPTVECFIKKNVFTVQADIPGVDPKDIDISITGNVLTIKGKREAAHDAQKEGYLFHEACYGAFERSMSLPEGVDSTGVHAVYRNGVLELTMPTKVEALPKKIKIDVEEAKTEKKAA